MNILVIEDDDNKRKQLVNFLAQQFSDVAVTETRSYQGGLKELLRGRYDHVFLDMTMPTFDKSPSDSGGRLRPLAGKDILAQLKHRQIRQNVIVFTQFEILGEGEQQVTLSELDNDLRAEYPENYKTIIYYDAAQDEWKLRVLDAISRFAPRAEA